MTCRCPDAYQRGAIARTLRSSTQAEAFRRDLQVIHRMVCCDEYISSPDYSHEWLMKMKRRGLKTLQTHGYLAFEERT